MLNSFLYKEENTDILFLCNVYEITGMTLQNFFDKYNRKNINNINKGLPLPYVRIIAKQILIGLDFIHRFGEIIHTNLNMSNILICLTKEELELIQETGRIYLEEEKDKEIYDKKNINTYEAYDCDIDDLIPRPRVSSVPKVDIDNHKYNFNIIAYSNNIQEYIKEKNKIIINDRYKKDLLIKKNLLEQSRTYKNKIDILKQLNKESFLKGPILDTDIKIKLTGFNHYIKLKQRHGIINYRFNTKQQEQYLPPEIILNYDFNETIDIWALACIIFELATNEPLFTIKKDSNFSKNENLILQYIEILGIIPKKIINRMKNQKKYFDIIKKISITKNIKRRSIKDLLISKYNFMKEEAEALSDFLLQMLVYDPDKRATAKKMMTHPWLNMPMNFDYICNKKNGIVNNNEEINLDLNESDCEEYMADDEDNNKGDIYNEFKYEDESGDDDPDKIIIKNYNNSFAEYGQFIDLTSLDKANPQFDEIIKKDEQ